MSRRNPRYPGDQDPTNLGFAVSRRRIASAIRELRADDRKVVKELIENPAVDTVTVRSDLEDSGEFISIVLSSGLVEFSWIAYFRDYERNMYDPERVDRFFVRAFRSNSMSQYRSANAAALAFLFAVSLEPRPNPFK